MIKKENIKIKQLNDLDNLVEVKTIYNNKEFKLLYSHTDIKSNKEIDAVIEDFIKNISEYQKILNEVIKNKKPIQKEKKIRKNYFINTIFAQGGKTEQEKELLDIYYLNREEIKDIKYNITNQKIEVGSATALYINIKPYKEINKKELLKKRLEIIRAAKSQGISISYKNKTKNTIIENWNDYKKDIQISQEIYQELKERWTHIRDNRGLHMGTSDDVYLDKTTQLQWDYEKLNNRGKSINKMQNIARDIENLYDEIVINRYNKNYAKIFL